MNAEADKAASPRWGFIILMGVASSLSAFGMASVVPALPTLSRALATDYASLQFVVSAYLLGLGLFQPIQGLLCDRFGRRPVFLAGFALFGIASLFASMASSVTMLVLARFLQAMGVSVATVVSRAIVRDSFEPGPAAVALSFITAVMGVAPVLAPLVGGVIADYLGWRGIFWIHAGVSLLLVGVLFTQLKETRPADTESMSFGDLVRGGRFLVTQPGFMGPSLTYSFFSASGFIFITVGAALYETMFDMSGAEFGLLWSGLAFSFIAGATSAGHLARRFGSARSQRIGMGCNGIATAAFVIAAFMAAAPMWLFSLSLALLMFANGVVQPLALTAAVDDHPQLAGVAAGLSSSIAMLISMVSAITTGAIYDGTARGCAILMSAACILAVVSLRLGEKTHPISA